MANDEVNRQSRRAFLKASATAAAAGLGVGPNLCLGAIGVAKPMKRPFGRTGFEVSTLGLGGQASLQWTPPGVDPEPIILKAIELGVNYFDTSNVYGPSQLNYGKALRRLHLVPGTPSYDEKKRRSIFLTSKTYLRWAKGPVQRPGVRSRTNGPPGSTAVDDLKRTLSQVFGDGRGKYPPGAYVDGFLIHTLWTMEDIAAVYEGLDNPDPKADRIGALAALVDYRDGTNRTGLNPKEEKLVRHIGFSGHHSPPVMMEMMQRDRGNVLDLMLVAVNANDRLYFNQQYNAIPVAVAKGMGIIAMKVFADGAMYTKDAVWSNKPEHVVHTVGSRSLPSRPLVEYSLSTPGIGTAIIGIGHIDNQPHRCQLAENMSAAQIRPGRLSETDREAIEQDAAQAKEGKTNWFQIPAEPLGPPREAAVIQEHRNGRRIARLTWQTAYAGNQPLSHYEIRRDNRTLGQVEHRPQVTKSPFTFEDALKDKASHVYEVVTVDAAGRRAARDKLALSASG
jgi:aryl-alcohol dehydrogenase-like predicted oxidoreductase